MWAAVAGAGAAKSAAPVPTASDSSGSIAVVDANAIISGIKLDSLGDAIISTEEVRPGKLHMLRRRVARKAVDA